MDHLSDRFDSRCLGSRFSGGGFQRHYSAGMGFGMGFSSFRAGCGSLPPRPFNLRPTNQADQNKPNSRTHGHPAPKRRNDEIQHEAKHHLASGSSADTRPRTTPHDSATCVTAVSPVSKPATERHTQIKLRMVPGSARRARKYAIAFITISLSAKL
jgi:hypothetical protein